jgi:hypothetical protein
MKDDETLDVEVRGDDMEYSAWTQDWALEGEQGVRGVAVGRGAMTLEAVVRDNPTAWICSCGSRIWHAACLNRAWERMVTATPFLSRHEAEQTADGRCGRDWCEGCATEAEDTEAP